MTTPFPPVPGSNVTFLRAKENLADLTDGSAAYQTLGGDHSVKLQGWFAALAGRGQARANVAVIGDSIVAGQGADSFAASWPQRLAVLLRSRFGVTGGGRGFLPPIIPPSNPTSYTPEYVALSGPGAGSLDTTGLYGFGPNLETWDISANGGTTVTYSLNGDSADILWAGAAGNGTIGWAVTGGGSGTIDTNVDFTVAGTTHISLGMAGAHTLTITNSSGGPTFLTGVVEYDGDFSSGIQVHGLGFSGSTTGFWTVAGGATDQAPALAPLAPDLIVIALCVNDLASGILPPASGANLSSIISGIRTALADASLTVPPFLLLGDYNAAQDGPTSVQQWQQYLGVMEGIAAGDDEIDFLGLAPVRMPSTSAAQTWDLYDVDGIHPLDRGAQMIADYACQFLSPA